MPVKHTPGPWNVRYFRPEEPELGFFIEAKNNNKPELGYGIEILMDDFGEHSGYPFEQRLADAKLIAAAPELLAALEYYFEHGQSSAWHDMAKAAIQKTKQ